MIKLFIAFFSGVTVAELGIGDTLPQTLVLMLSLMYVAGVAFLVGRIYEKF